MKNGSKSFKSSESHNSPQVYVSKTKLFKNVQKMFKTTNGQVVHKSKCQRVKKSKCPPLPIHQCLIENILHEGLNNRGRKAFLNGIQILIARIILISRKCAFKVLGII